MKTLREMGPQAMIWTHPRMFQRYYELRTGDEIGATLQWAKGWGSLATATTGEGVWTFKRSGFLNPRVTIRVAGTETDIAQFAPRWNGKGTLEFADGRQFSWMNTNFWATQWTWKGPEGQDILTFQRTGMLKSDTQIVIEAAMLGLPEIPLLSTLGWYLLVLNAEDTAATTAATTVAL